MGTEDSEELRGLLVKLLPGLVVDSVITASGQRAVYFSHFASAAEQPKGCTEWGNIVLKATEELQPKEIAYLQNEIAILNKLKSPFYPTLYYNEVFTHDPDTEDRLPNRVFVTIEQRIESTPLSECVEAFREPSEICQLLIKLVDALRLLWEHKPSLVHRDIKPANILIKPDGEVAIIDLGIVREEGAEGLTAMEAPWGPCTPTYASPEQAKNDKDNINFKSDFYLLGVLAYELATGENPHITPEDKSVGTILDNVRNLTPAPLKESHKMNESFSNLIESLLSKEPYQRPRSVKKLLDRIVITLEELDGD